MYSNVICNSTNGLITRIENTDPAYNDKYSLGLDDASKKNIATLRQTGKDDGLFLTTSDNKKYNQNIARFFTNKKTYFT
jgi:hypothetical protein